MKCENEIDGNCLETLEQCKGCQPSPASDGYASVAEFVPVTQSLPVAGMDVIGLNTNSNQMEFGFRSTEDKHISRWLDFSFPVTHWAYYKIKA